MALAAELMTHPGGAYTEAALAEKVKTPVYGRGQQATAETRAPPQAQIPWANAWL